MNLVSEMSPETKTRVITGVAGGTLLLFLIIFGGSIGISLFAAILGATMSYELARAFLKLSDKKEKIKALLGVAWIFIFINLLIPKTMLECLIAAFMGLFSYYLAIADRHQENLKEHFDEFVFSVFILVYVVSFVSFLPLIRDGANGVKWVLLFLFIVWSGDTGAYFVGKKYGKQKLYPLISPKKTVEGALGGLGASLLVSILFKLIFFRSLGILGMLITPVLVGAVSQMGDLCESFFKRAYGMKDSGKILPGHGGMLDRFDGVLFSIPVMYLCVKIFSSG